MGSEMCIRDRFKICHVPDVAQEFSSEINLDVVLDVSLSVDYIVSGVVSIKNWLTNVLDRIR